ncbi:Na+/H+ antiporter subunit D [Novosphingobium sp. FGD1]|jgi:multicomponent Na+:H+ antiporter subunit D|uniref:Na+/H+ antiporter subunit D n=1 Tax=Novosphingobium silvae TaxID=2692619 RepID=A0A7X4K8J3_9SPHN|nr:proton-conducting transporter membrane subunit [Novosphingobium silvae]MYL98363.1 Na+/H+ antiporter subunit D [Novosphingobium silvae]
MADTLLLVSPVLVAFLGSAIAILLRVRPSAARLTGLTTNVLLAACSLALLVRVGPGTSRVPHTVFGGWPRGFGISFAASLPGVLLVAVTALVSCAAAIYAIEDIGPRRRRAGYDALMLALIGAVNGAFLTTDLFNLYVWFELALLAALGLLTLDRRAAQIDGAIRYVAFATLAATFILLGIGMIYGLVGNLDLAMARSAISRMQPAFGLAIAAALLLGGFALKSGLAPFHLWLPASYHTAPVTGTATFAGLLTKMGFYALMLVLVGLLNVTGPASAARHLMLLVPWIAGATMILCAIGALGQTDMRRILSYQVIAQVGYMATGLALGTIQGVAGAVFYMVHTIIVQANLFFGAGLIHRASGSWDLTRAGGMRTNPVFTMLFAVPMLSLAGIPPLSGFWAKLIVLRESLEAGYIWLAVAGLVAGLMTIVSMAIFWSEACWKDSKRPVRPVPRSGLLAMALLSTATGAIGLAPHWLWQMAQASALALAGGLQ